jgi:hypothetical protein
MYSGFMDRNLFCKPLTPEEEYWIGYIRADGALTCRPYGNRDGQPVGYTKTVWFSQKLEEPVRALSDFLGKPKWAVTSKSGSAKFGPYTGFQVTDSKVADALYRLGVKSQLDQDLYASRHFWRGLIDGDGSVFYSRYGNNLSPTLSCCGSLADMTEFSTWISQMLECPAPAVSKHRSTVLYYVSVARAKAVYLAALLYRGQYSALTYKRETAASFDDWQPIQKPRYWNRVYQENK